MRAKNPEIAAIQLALAEFCKEQGRTEFLRPGGTLNYEKLADALGKNKTSLSRMSGITVDQLERQFGMPPGELQQRSQRILEEQARRKTATSEAEFSPDQVNHTRQLEGSYQIIRPHTHVPDRFVLEPMQIWGVDGSNLEIEMCSVRFPTSALVYVGQAWVHYPRFLFALMKRPRSTPSSGSTFRSIAMQVDLLTHSPGCFAGILLRGSATNSVVAYRFAAIKAARAHPRLDNDQLSRLSSISFTIASTMEPPVHRVLENESILIGEVGKTNMPRVFALCKNVFAKWAAEDREEVPGLKLQSIHKDDITRIITKTMGRASQVDVYDGWRRLVAEDLKKHLIV
jgi:hypothetical protein